MTELWLDGNKKVCLGESSPHESSELTLTTWIVMFITGWAPFHGAPELPTTAPWYAMALKDTF